MFVLLSFFLTYSAYVFLTYFILDVLIVSCARFWDCVTVAGKTGGLCQDPYPIWESDLPFWAEGVDWTLT